MPIIQGVPQATPTYTTWVFFSHSVPVWSVHTLEHLYGLLISFRTKIVNTMSCAARQNKARYKKLQPSENDVGLKDKKWKWLIYHYHVVTQLHLFLSVCRTCSSCDKEEIQESGVLTINGSHSWYLSKIRGHSPFNFFTQMHWRSCTLVVVCLCYLMTGTNTQVWLSGRIHRHHSGLPG